MGADPVTLGLKVDMTAASMAMTAMQKIEGPRLDSLDVTTADYGTPIPRFWGKRRLDGVPIIWAEKLREKKTTSKTKGGKYAEYKYFGTFAVIIADHEIDSISRIWMDKHIVYDLTRAGPISPSGGFFSSLSGSPIKLARGRNMRIYDGTQTSPDPRMEAWCEDRYGADTCPAYKGISYIVFQNIPLEKFGNRLPQVSVEAVNNKTDNYLWEDSPEVSSLSGPLRFSADYTRYYADGSIWDAATRTRIAMVDFQPDAMGSGWVAWNVTDGIGASGGPYLWRYTNDGQSVQGPWVAPHITDEIYAFDDTQVYFGSNVGTVVQIFNGGAFAVIDITWHPTDFERDSEDNTWACGTQSAGTTIYLECIDGPRLGDAATVTAGNSGFPRLFINSQDQFILELDGEVYKLDNDFTLLDSATITGTGTFSYQRGTDTFWRCTSGTASEYSLNTLTLIRTLDEDDWVGAPGGFDEGQYSPITHSILTKLSGHIVHHYLDRLDSSGVNLGDVVSDVADWCGIEEVDVSDLDQIVQGYSVTQGAGKDMIAPLLDIHDVDARPHDFGVQFITRGNAPLGTINVSEFVREGDEPRYRLTDAGDTDIGRQISISFADQDKDQQTNTVISQRPLDALDAEGTKQIDLTTYVGTPGDIQKFSDRYFRRKWNSKQKVENAVTAQYLGLEPADVYNLALDGVTWTGLLQRVTLSQGRIALEWRRDEIGLHTLGTGSGSPMDGRDDDEILIPSPTKGFVKDIPLAEDGHASDLPILYYGASDYPNTTFWPGATLYEGDSDGDDYLAWKGVEPADKASWGYATEALADANPNCWDRGNSVNVSPNVELTTVTEAEIDADPTLNLALLGG
jgi:hypothetical protein